MFFNGVVGHTKYASPIVTQHEKKRIAVCDVWLKY
jgi:hypothetical protein